MENKQITLFFDKLTHIIDGKKLIKLVLSSQRDPSTELKSIIVTIIEIKKGTRLNFVYRHKTKDITKNYEVDEAMSLIMESMEKDFFNADLFSKRSV